ncbi:MAG: ADYC domain-containing protein [Stellaceae bacterium]
MIRPAATGLAVAAGLIVGSPSPAVLQTTVRSIEVEGTAFRITLSDGHELREEELPGIQLMLGDGSGRQRRVRIDAVERDSRDAAGEVVLYKLSEQDAASGEWRNLCELDPDGRRLGFPLAGAFTGDGRHVAMAGRFLITCTGGAEGKCIRFGYKPWRKGPDGASLAPYYQACVRLVRADYCGDGVGHTRNGTPIDLFDTIGIQSDEVAPGMTFEAAWGADGAVCVRHTRLKDVLDLSTLAAQCPRLARGAGEGCDEAMPALLFNRSYDR